MVEPITPENWISSVNHKFNKAHKAEREGEIVGVLGELERASDVVNVTQIPILHMFNPFSNVFTRYCT